MGNKRLCCYTEDDRRENDAKKKREDDGDNGMVDHWFTSNRRLTER